MDFEKFSKDLAESSRKAKKKATLLTVIPLVVGLVWLIFCAYQVSVYNGEVEADRKIADSLNKQATNQIQTINANQKNLDSLQKMNASIQNQILAMQSQLISLQNENPCIQGVGDSSSFRKMQFSIFNLISKYSGIKYDSLSSSIVQQRQTVVYIQVASANGKTAAEKLAVQIRDMKYTVPQIEIIKGKEFITEVKYYHKEDSLAATAISEQCKKFYGPDYTTYYSNFPIKYYGNTKYKAANGQIEVWIKQ
jgi:hypothetical protein